MLKYTLLMTLFFSCIVKADLSNTTLFKANIMYVDRSFSNGTTSTSYKTQDLDLRLGRVFKKVYAGIISSQSNYDLLTANRSSLGVSLGYFSDKDVYLMVHYFVSSKYQEFSTLNYQKGSGTQVDLGGLFKLSSSFLAGMLFSYKSLTYSELVTNGVSTTVNLSHREMLPMFTLAVSL